MLSTLISRRIKAVVSSSTGANTTFLKSTLASHCGVVSTSTLPSTCLVRQMSSKPQSTSSQSPRSKSIFPGGMKTLDNMQDEPIIDKPATANASRASRSNHPGKQQEQDEQEMSAEELNRRERVRANMDAKEAQKHARVVRGTMLVMLTASLMTFVYLGSPSDNDDPAPENESAFGGYWRRTKKNLGFITAVATDPIYAKLLPDPLPAPHQQALTLVIELNDTLSHLDWDKSHGWRVAARPGVTQFLTYLARYYEIVIFANTPGFNAQPVADAVDPYGAAPYKLYRESTRLVDSHFVKDMSILNRDLGKVLCVDVDANAYKLQPENYIPLQRWKGEKGDGELIRLMTFLEELAMLATFAQVNDVRPILATVRSINPDDLPAAWEEYKNRFKQQVHAEQEELAKQQSSKGNLAARLLGSRRNSASSAQKPVSMFELIEQACREERTMFAKQFDSLKEMKKQQEAEHLRQIEEMKSKNLKMADYIGMQYNGVPPNQQPQQ